MIDLAVTEIGVYQLKNLGSEFNQQGLAFPDEILAEESIYLLLFSKVLARDNQVLGYASVKGRKLPDDKLSDLVIELFRPALCSKNYGSSSGAALKDLKNLYKNTPMLLDIILRNLALSGIIELNDSITDGA